MSATTHNTFVNWPMHHHNSLLNDVDGKVCCLQDTVAQFVNSMGNLLNLRYRISFRRAVSLHRDGTVGMDEHTVIEQLYRYDAGIELLPSTIPVLHCSHYKWIHCDAIENDPGRPVLVIGRSGRVQLLNYSY